MHPTRTTPNLKFVMFNPHRGLFTSKLKPYTIDPGPYILNSEPYTVDPGLWTQTPEPPRLRAGDGFFAVFHHTARKELVLRIVTLSHNLQGLTVISI